MATELGQWLTEKLEVLPEDHPDRPFLEDLGRTVEDYLITHYVDSEPKGEENAFTESQREFLERRGFVVYKLTGKSLRECAEKIHSMYLNEDGASDFTELTTKPVEVAVKFDTNSPYWKDQTSNEIPAGTKYITGEANQYAELAIAHFEETGEGLFGSDGFQYDTTTWIKTQTKANPDSSYPIAVAFIWGQVQLRESYYHDQLSTAPLVVPANY